MGSKSKLIFENKMFLLNVPPKPYWTYRIQLWGLASKSSINTNQSLQSETLRAEGTSTGVLNFKF